MPEFIHDSKLEVMLKMSNGEINEDQEDGYVISNDEFSGEISKNHFSINQLGNNN